MQEQHEEYACTHCGHKGGTTLEVRNATVHHDGVKIAVPVWIRRRCFGCGRAFVIDRIAYMHNEK